MTVTPPMEQSRIRFSHLRFELVRFGLPPERASLNSWLPSLQGAFVVWGSIHTDLFRTVNGKRKRPMREW